MVAVDRNARSSLPYERSVLLLNYTAIIYLAEHTGVEPAPGFNRNGLADRRDKPIFAYAPNLFSERGGHAPHTLASTDRLPSGADDSVSSLSIVSFGKLRSCPSDAFASHHASNMRRFLARLTFHGGERRA